MLHMKFALIGQAVLGKTIFENVGAHMDGRTPARVPYNKLPTSLRLSWAYKMLLGNNAYNVRKIETMYDCCYCKS